MGFSPGDWQLFYGIGLVVGHIWLANGMTDFYEMGKNMSKSWMRYLLGFIWAALIVTTTLGLMFWVRHTDGRDHYTAATWVAIVGVLLCVLFSPVFFGLFHREERSNGSKRKWMIAGFFLVLGAFGCFLTVSGLQLDAYVDSGSPNDVELAFWLTLPLTIWLGIATVWAGLWAWGYYKGSSYKSVDNGNENKAQMTFSARISDRRQFCEQVV